MILKQLKQPFFKSNLGLLFSARENILNNFKCRLFLIKNLDKIPTHERTFKSAFQPAPEPTPETTKARRVKLNAKYLH